MGGSLGVTEQGSWAGVDGVYYHPEAPANVLSLAMVRDMCKVGYDGARDTFTVMAAHGEKLEFRRRGNHYAYRVARSAGGRQPQLVLLETVEANEKMFIKREVEDVRVARRAAQALGFASSKDLAQMLRSGSIANAPFTVQDVVRAERIWGKDIGSLKGKAKKQTPRAAKVEYVPRVAQQELAMHADIMCDRVQGNIGKLQHGFRVASSPTYQGVDARDNFLKVKRFHHVVVRTGT